MGAVWWDWAIIIIVFGSDGLNWEQMCLCVCVRSAVKTVNGSNHNNGLNTADFVKFPFENGGRETLFSF